MRSITLIASILSLALATTAAPTLQARWCTPVCCCGDVCTVDEVCQAGLDNSVTYCCSENLETATPEEIAWLYLEGTCIIEPTGA